MQQLLTHFEAYLMTQKCVARNTYQAYRADVLHFINFLQTHAITKLQDIAQQTIHAYLTELKESHKAARSVARKISAIKLFLEYVEKHHAIKLQKFDMILPKVTKKLPLYCTPDEIAQLLRAAQEDTSKEGQRTLVIVSLLYATGIRVSELVGLTRNNIHYDTAILDVRGKGGKTRQIPLTEPLVALLRNYTTQLPKNSEYLFCVQYGKKVQALSRQAVWTLLKKLVRKSLIQKDISPHTLRHSLATHSLQEGWDLRSLQLLLGHEQISTVTVYTHVEVSQLRSAYNKKHPRS